VNEELKQKAAQALSEILDLALKTKDFAVEQAPDAIRQLLAWHFTLSFLSTSVFLCILGLLVLAGRYLWVHRPIPDSCSTRDENAAGRNPKDAEWCNRGIACAIWIISALVFLVGFGASNLIWLKIWVAPKLFLLEYAATLVK
jgi:hypothetical protein